MEFVPRFDALVISDASGLFLAHRKGAIAPLPVNDKDRLGTPSATFDLPTLSALLVSRIGSELLLRWDDGEIVHLADLQKGNFITDADVTPNGQSIEIHTYRGTVMVNIPTRKSPGKVAEKHENFEIQEFRVRDLARGLPREIQIGVFVYRTNASSIGKTFLRSEKGLFELTGTTTKAVSIPLQYGEDRIEDVFELPASKAVFVFSKTNVFVIDNTGLLAEVPGGREVGSYRIGHSRGIIPVRTELIIAGRRSLYLGIDRRLSGEGACIAGKLSAN